MSLVLYNTFTRQKELFEPLDPAHVRLYVCGPTVYDFAHIGNARPYVIFDVLSRLLRSLYPRVSYVRNITDIDDKIIKAAQEKGEEISQLTARTAQYFRDDMKALGNIPPDIEPHATAHVDEMIAMIQTLIKKGHAYESDGHVLFSVKSFPPYGQLSHCNHEEMIAGARVEVASYKKDPEDFILWKPSDAEIYSQHFEACPRESGELDPRLRGDKTRKAKSIPGWDSPWGYGRPGWHIECSAMSLKYLGETFDIHGGGHDLIFPHHENELAQSQACFGPHTFARTWIHNGMLTVGGEKMSKSLGNFRTVHELLAQMPGELIRFILLSSHYRQPLDWNDQVVLQGRGSLDRLYNALRGRIIDEAASPTEPLKAAIDDDLNTPLAISVLHDIASRLHKASSASEKDQLASQLKASGVCLGLLQQDADSWFKGAVKIDEETIRASIDERNRARKEKNFAQADRVRDDLLRQGIILEDSAQGTIWRR